MCKKVTRSSWLGYTIHIISKSTDATIHEIAVLASSFFGIFFNLEWREREKVKRLKRREPRDFEREMKRLKRREFDQGRKKLRIRFKGKAKGTPHVHFEPPSGAWATHLPPGWDRAWPIACYIHHPLASSLLTKFPLPLPAKVPQGGRKIYSAKPSSCSSQSSF